MENVNIHYDIFTQITNIEIPEPKKENKNNNNSGGGVPSLNRRVATGSQWRKVTYLSSALI